MALIHEKLYQSANLAEINFALYAQQLAEGLFRLYRVDPGAVTLQVDIQNIALDINQAIPCGLIINELVSNCLKYAFPQGHTGQVRVALFSENSQMALVVADNGVGLPDDIDWENVSSLGLQLVRTLATHDLRGAIELDRQGGTAFRITFAANRQARGADTQSVF
jgi:two-component sensor histidine kinase